MSDTIMYMTITTPQALKEESMWTKFLQAIGFRSKCCNAPFGYYMGAHYKGYDDYTGCSNCGTKK